MKKNLKRLEGIISKNKYFIMGFVLVMLYLFSNCILNNYIVSYTNINYTMQPFSSQKVGTAGPILSDVADSTYPLKYQVFYSDEEISCWDNNIALGTTIKTSAELLYPGNIVYLFPMELAISLKVILEFFVGFFSMYMFMSALGIQKYSAAITGVIYTFSSAIVLWLGWPHSDVSVLAPLLFFGVEKLLSEIKIKYMLLITLVIYTMLMAGMPTYVAYFMYLAGVYIVLFSFIKHWKNKKNIFVVGTMFAFSVILAVIMSMPYTVELLEQVVGNGYVASRQNYAELQLDFEYIRTFLFPYAREGLNAHINETTLYLGILPIVLLPLCIVNTKNKKRNIFFIITSIIVFCLIFTGLFNFVYAKLPAVNTSLKYRVIALLMFSMSVVAGLTLNDVIENGRKYWKKKWLIAIQIIWSVAVLYVTTEEIYQTQLSALRKVTFITLILLMCIIMLMRRKSKLFQAVLALVVIIDSVGFAKAYLPYIDASAKVIPEATDSVEYMSDNVAEEERVLGIGSWNLFPNTNVYYDLNDIRVHGFIATNSDIRGYYEAISEEAYETNTRIEFSTIDNYELLKYIGVKYVYSSALGNIVEVFDDYGTKNAIGEIAANTVVREEFAVEENAISVQILFATYASIPKGKDNLIIHIYDEAGDRVSTHNYSTEQLRDNEYLKIDISDLQLEAGNYEIELVFKDMGTDKVTLWAGNSKNESFIINNQKTNGNLIMNVIYPVDEYEIVFEGEDGLEVGKLTEYADKVELVEKVIVLPDEKAILDAMSKDYLDNTIFMTEDSGQNEYDIPLTDNESITVEEYSNEYIKIICDTEYERYVSVNDYYADGWNAYVNGRQVDIEKVNYLTRAIKVQAGEEIIIEMKYEPTDMYVCIGCFAVSFLIWIVLFIFRNKLQKILDTKILKCSKE